MALPCDVGIVFVKPVSYRRQILHLYLACKRMCVSSAFTSKFPENQADNIPTNKWRG